MTPAALAKANAEEKQEVMREYMLRTRPGGVKGADHDALCDLLEINDPSRVIFEQGRGREAVVRVFPVNPLAKMRAITLPDLEIDETGCICVGSYYDGEPLRMRVHDPETGNAQRSSSSARPAPANPGPCRRSSPRANAAGSSCTSPTSRAGSPYPRQPATSQPMCGH